MKYLDVYGDNDWAGDDERKRSTTGVTKIFGGHPLDAASATNRWSRCPARRRSSTLATAGPRWIAQERLQKGKLLLKSVPTDENVADLMTQHLAAARVFRSCC